MAHTSIVVICQTTRKQQENNKKTYFLKQIEKKLLYETLNLPDPPQLRPRSREG
jgi:hypothetical protein